MKGFSLLVMGIVFVVLVGCGVGLHGSYPMEISRTAAVINPQTRAGAPVLFVNRWMATFADVRIYAGHKSRADVIGNINGRPVIYNDYIDKFRLENAYSDYPRTAKRVLDVNRPYTALVLVNWGVFGKVYDLYIVHLNTNADATRTVWQSPSGFDSVYVNNYIEVSGTNTPAYDRLPLTFTIYPNEIVRRGIKKALEK